MAGTSSSNSSGYSNSHSSSTPSVIQTPQSTWGLQLSQLLAALGQYQYNWAQNQISQGEAITNDQINNYMQLAGAGAGLAQNLLGRYENTFEPLMNQFIQQAGTYNSEGRQRFMMGQAESTAGQADTAAMNEAQRQLQGFGINPNSGRYQDLLLTQRVQDAANRAGAGTQASVNTAATGRQMLAQAAQMGQNIPGMTVNALQSAYTGVSGAENALLGMLNTGANLTNSAANFFNGAANANRLPPVANTSASQGQSRQQSASGSQQQNPQQQSKNQGNGGGAGARQAGTGGGYRGGNANQQVGTPYPSIAHPPKDNQNGDYNSDNGTGVGVNQPFYSPDLSPFADPNSGMQGADPFSTDPFNGGPLEQGAPGTFAGPGMWNTNGPANPQNPVPDVSGFQSAPGTNSLGGQGQPWSPMQTDPFNQLDTGQQPTGQPGQGFGDTGDVTGGIGGGLGGGQGGGFDQFDQQDSGAGQSQDFGNYAQPQDQIDQEAQSNADTQGQWDQYDQGTAGGSYGGQGSNDTQSGGNYTDTNGGGGGGYSGGDSGGGGGGGYYASGGAVRSRGRPTSGGFVPRSASPSGGRQTDDIPARLNAHEFVIPQDVVHHKGTQFFNNLIKKSRMVRTGMPGPKPQGKRKPALPMRPTFRSHYLGGSV